MPCFKYNSAFLANPDFSEGIGSWNFKLLNLTFSQSCLLYSVSKNKMKDNQIFNWPKKCLFTSVCFTEISWKFCLLADGQGVGIVFRHWIHFLNYLNKKSFKKTLTMLRFLLSNLRLLVKCSLLSWSWAGRGEPLNINLALTVNKHLESKYLQNLTQPGSITQHWQSLTHTFFLLHLLLRILWKSTADYEILNYPSPG